VRYAVRCFDLHGRDRKLNIVARHEENAHEHYQHNRLR
jgi:hypothetical protein